MGWRVKKRDFGERRVESQSICGLIWQSPTDLRFTRAIFPQRIYVRICAIGKGLIWHTGPCESQAGWEWARDVGCDRDPNLRNVGNLFWVSHCDTTLHAQWACQGAALFAVANSGQVELFLVSCHVFDQKCVATQTEAFRFAAYACAVCLSARLLVFFFLPIGPILGPTVLLFRCVTDFTWDFLPDLDGTYPSLIPCIFWHLPRPDRVTFSLVGLTHHTEKSRDHPNILADTFASSTPWLP